MKSKPVDASSLPNYPTRDELLSETDLLGRRMPRAWRLGRDLAGAATFFLAVSITGCDVTPPAAPATAEAADTQVAAKGPSRAASEAGAVVAPIFEHGEGRGATGCVVMTPPVFLTEDEAMQVIREELAKQKIDLKAGTTLGDVKVAPRVHQRLKGTEEAKVVQDDEQAAPLQPDGFDASRHVAVEFLSQNDYAKLGGVNPSETYILDKDGHFVGAEMSSVSEYNFKDAAKYLAGEVRRQEKQRLYIGVFYDPMVYAGGWNSLSAEERKDPKTAWEKLEKKGKIRSEALLRQQAKDFVAWLKKQGAL